MSLHVLYAPRNVSGQASEYAEAIRPFGLSGEVWSYGEPAFGFSADAMIDQDRLLADPNYRWKLFDHAVRTFDVFHFQYSRSLLNPEGVVLPELWDLPLLKSLGKRVVMHFRGSDVRRPTTHLAKEPDSYLARDTANVDEDRIAARITICRRYCDAMLVSTPGLLDEVPDAVWLPHVVDVDAWATPQRPEPAVPIVSHIPSARATKGSAIIDPAMRTLQERGRIEYRSLSGLSRDEVRAALQQTDLLIDSLTIGDHGLVSVEAMAAGAIPVAHIHPDNRVRNPGVPIVEATVDDVTAVVEGLADDPSRRAALRTRCLEFARRRHDRPVVGAQLAELYRQPPPVPDRAYPSWPRSEGRERVQQLEARIDELEADLDPVVQGIGPLTRTIPEWVTARLLARIAELEDELRRLAPESDLLQTSTARRWRRPTRRRLRDRLKQHPELHRLVRRSRRMLRRRFRR